MINEIRKNIKAYYIEKLSCYVSFLIGLLLITSIPYSAGAAHNWYIPLLDGYYNITFFNFSEITLLGSAILIYGIWFETRYEKTITLSLAAMLLAKILSIFFADIFELIQLVSLVRSVEIFLCIYVLSNLLSQKKKIVMLF